MHIFSQSGSLLRERFVSKLMKPIARCSVLVAAIYIIAQYNSPNIYAQHKIKLLTHKINEYVLYIHIYYQLELELPRAYTQKNQS